MVSTRTLVFLLCALAVCGCKKHAVATSDEAGESDAGTDAGNMGDATTDAEADASPTDAALDAAPADADTDADTDDNDDTVPTNGSFAGTYNCFGGITLVQTGTQVTGTGHSHIGSATETTEVLCTIKGHRCVGQAIYFTQKGSGSPKSTGKGKLVLKVQGGAVHYTTTHGGVQQGLCARN
jgi:hypothetical protein